MNMSTPVPAFHSIYSHGFARVAVGVPFLRVADPQYNLERTLGLAQRAHDNGAALVLFPELGLSAYSNDDLFHQDALLDAVENAIQKLLEASRALAPVLLVGAPLRFENRLFNCAVIVHGGKVLGVAPKTYLPNYREFYEKRQFASGREALGKEVWLCGQHAPFGNDLVFDARSPSTPSSAGVSSLKNFTFGVEICEDAWTPIPPSTYHALGGALVLANLSASNITVGKADYRRDLCASQSGKCVAAYLYSAAGPGESTTDLAWDGHALIYENNEKLAESQRFPQDEQLICADIDLERLSQDRMRQTSFADSVRDHAGVLASLRRIEFNFAPPQNDTTKTLRRTVERFPYVPDNPAQRDERCYEAYNIQVHGLKKRLEFTGIEKVVIGVSGGLDSTHALIVAARTMDSLGLPRANILAYTMPGFATSSTTLENAHALMKALGVTAHELDIRPSCNQMLSDLGHPFVDGEPVYDITFENVQAGERTSHLFRLANFHNGIVLGTGDLSELALGWCTYGVGDHMSHYNVNASVPKTLIQYLIRWVVASQQFDEATGNILLSILDTEISPELVPHDDNEDLPEAERTKPAQSTQAKIGPYELQDFHLYYITRYGFRPSKVAFLSHAAWGDKSRGDFPEHLPVEKRNEYSLAEIKHWLEVFLWRFFQTSQFKRSCVPNGPKVGSGGSLSPRGDWRAPSDSQATVWLEELKKNVP
jgi:NAD+ synthase (glutamine-hydrolysing)